MVLLPGDRDVSRLEDHLPPVRRKTTEIPEETGTSYKYLRLPETPGDVPGGRVSESLSGVSLRLG